VGLHADPRRAEERRPPRRPLDHSADPEGVGLTTGPAADDVVADVSPIALGRDRWGRFFTTEVWTWHGLATYYTVFVIDLASRRIQVLGPRHIRLICSWARWCVS